jgi:GTPase
MKGRESGDEILAVGVSRREERAERAVSAPRPLYHSKKLFDVGTCDPPVPERAQGGEIPLVPRVEKSRRRLPEYRENALHGSLDGRDAAEGEGGGEESHDLSIRRIGVAMRKDERIGVEPPGAPLAPQSLEAFREKGEIEGAARAPFHTSYASIPVVSPRIPEKEAPPPPERKPDSRRTILVGVYGREIPREMAEDQLDELERLVETAGGQVVARALQERRGPDPATYVGSGKVEEIAEAARAQGVGWTVFDDELTPTQARNLEKKLPTQVLDRAGVILRIFAARARSREAMTQVELARLQYELPRLSGPSQGLAQQRGGGAFRGGAGERKIELDRRRVRTRIARLKEELSRIETQRDVRRKGLKRVATVSLVGYTNAGKTTLFNRLTASTEFAEDRLFATLDPRHARLHGVEGRAIVLTDTVGFLRKLPHTLVASFKSTLAEVKDADLLVHVVDASSAQAAEQRAVAEEVIAGFGVEKRRILLAYNKTDRPHQGALAADGIPISAATGEGLPLLREAIVARLTALGARMPFYGPPS